MDPSELPAVSLAVITGRQLTIDDLPDFSSNDGSQPESSGSDSSDGELLLAARRNLRQIMETMEALDAESSSESSDSSGEQPASGGKRVTAEHAQLL